MEQYGTTRADSEIFILCYRKYKQNMVMYLHNMIRDWDIAEELAQDAFIKLYEKDYKLDPESRKTVNLIITVAKNAALDYLKRKKRETRKYQEKHYEDVILNESLYQSLEDTYIQSEVISTLHDAIDEFPGRVREALLDRFYNDKKTCAVSQERKVSKYRIRQAEKVLQEKVKKRLKNYY